MAAVLIEPVQGEAGIPARAASLFAEDSRVDGTARHCYDRRRSAMWIGPHRQTVCRIEHYGIVPDLIVTAKSMGAGMPIGGVTGRAEIMDSAHLGGVGSTYGGAPLSCVAAIEALTMIRQPEFLAYANHLGVVMRKILEGWKAKYPLVGDVRGLGPMLLIELVKDRDSKEPLPAADALAIIRDANSHGVILIRAGLYSNCVRFSAGA